jgi:hypothetical protein
VVSSDQHGYRLLGPCLSTRAWVAWWQKKCEHGGRRNGGALRACAAGAGGHARTRWSAAGTLVVRAARIRRARLCRGRSPAGLAFPLRPMLLGAGLCGAGRAGAAAGAAAYAGPGRAVAGGVRWGVRGACADGVGARPRRGLRCRVSEGRGGSGYPGRRTQGRWAYACRALTM